MRILINESEKNRILGLYGPKFLFEQVNYTISDLQSLIGVAVDNNLGPNTALKLKQILSSIPGNGCSASSTSTSNTSTTSTNTGYQPGRDPMNPDV